MENNKNLLYGCLVVLGLYLLFRLTNNNVVETFKNNKNKNDKNKSESFHAIKNVNNELENYDKLNKLCEAVELQDEIKQEKLKLEKTKQYYLKLQKQKDEITSLEEKIQKLQKVRNDRTKSNDALNLIKYEKQATDEEKIRQKMLNTLDNQKVLDIDLSFSPYKNTT